MKKVLGIVFFLLLALLFLAGTAYAVPTEDIRDKTEELVAAETRNEGTQNYSNWFHPVSSYLNASESEIYQRVEKVGDSFVVEQYNDRMQMVWKKTLKMELPLWGGYYCGEDYNFVVFGQSNPEEDNDLEVVRVVRYSKNWNRQASASVCGANTTIPFRAGTVRMAENGGYLIVHTCHQMYKSSDGLNHQANMSFKVEIESMEVARSNTVVSNPNHDYVSHSFNQFVISDDTNVVKVDHGDAYSRAVSLYRITADNAAKRVSLLKISGETGDNYTGVNVGGLEASGTHYLVAGNSVDQGNFEESSQKNIFVAAVPAGNLTAESVTLNWLTQYAESDGVQVGNPQLVKITADRFLLLWTEAAGSDPAVLKYTFLDGTGKGSGTVYTSEEASLSDCQPAVEEGRVLWYVTRNTAAIFFEIRPDDPSVIHTLLYHGWREEDGGKVYYGNDGTRVTGFYSVPDDGTYTVQYHRYYFDGDGIMQTGFQAVDGKKYYLGTDGILQTSKWLTLDGKTYCLDEDGAVLTGLADRVEEAWVTGEDGEWTSVDTVNTYYFDGEGVRQTGVQSVNGKKYCFAGDGKMLKSRWVTADKKKYHAGEDGVLQTGRLTLTEEKSVYDRETGEWVRQTSENTYYLDGEGVMQTGFVTIGVEKFYFDEDGILQRSCWVAEDGKRYHLNGEGSVQTGLLTLTETERKYDEAAKKYVDAEAEHTYYLDSEGVMQKGFQVVGGKKYYFGSNGILQKNCWITQDGQRYHLNAEGTADTGWVTLTEEKSRYDSETESWIPYPVENTYYLNEDGVMQTGPLTVGGKKYILGDDGVALKSRWYTAEDGEIYLGDDGAMRTGWLTLEEDKTEYDFETDTFKTSRGKNTYYLDARGIRQTGFQAIDGKTYYFDTDGILQASRWLTLDGKTYYMGEDGTVVTGWADVTEKETVQDGNGNSAQKDVVNTYYFDGDGVRQTGLQVIDGKKYVFREDGVLQKSQWVTTGDGTLYLGGDGAAVTGDVILPDEKEYSFDEEGFLIIKEDPEWKAPAACELVYTGSAQKLAEAGTVTGGEMQYALGTNASAAPQSGWTAEIPAGTETGTYYVWYKVKGDRNHNDTAPAVLTVTIEEKPKCLPGDVNGDGEVDGRDAVRLMKYLAGEEDPETGEVYEIHKKNADVNADGKDDEKDLLRLVQYLGGKPVTLEEGTAE